MVITSAVQGTCAAIKEKNRNSEIHLEWSFTHLNFENVGVDKALFIQHKLT